MNPPLISVIIPAYNCEKTIESAINSILNQTYKNIEIIVVDDKSTDKTKEVVERIALQENRVTLVETETDDPTRFDEKLNRNINAGYSARNTGIKYAKGELITFQDADDSSLLNRIEIQYELLKKHDATHITTDWVQFNEIREGKKFNIEKFEIEKGVEILGPKELFELSKKTKGFAMRILGKYHSKIPFYLKRARLINKLFFRSVQPYPGVTGIPLFKKEVIERIQFRPLKDRVWPSFMGRGVDRDFSFQVAEKFKNSYVFFIPLYLWRVKNENPRFTKDIDQFII